jgi:hypothetical protein
MQVVRVRVYKNILIFEVVILVHSPSPDAHGFCFKRSEIARGKCDECDLTCESSTHSDQ